jgi:hypothetical protein
LLQIEVRINRTSQKKFISTGIYLLKNQFSEKNGFTCLNHPNSQLITGKARHIFNQIEAFALSKNCPDLKAVLQWNVPKTASYLVVDFIQDELRRRNSSLNVVECHNSLITRLNEFSKIKTFSDFTYENIVDFKTCGKGNHFLQKYLPKKSIE